MRPEDLYSVVAAVSDALKASHIKFALTGGLAVAAWAPQEEVFETGDVDFGVLAPRKDPALAILATVPGAAPVKTKAYVDLGRVSFIKVMVSGINVDFVLPRNAAFVREAFRHVGRIEVVGTTIPVLSPEDVFLYKSMASRPKDVKGMYSLSRRGDFNWKYVVRWSKKLGTHGALRELRLI